MNCETTRAQMHTLLDGGSRELVGEAARHVAECERCRVCWQQLGELEHALGDAVNDAVVVPADLHARLMDRLQVEAGSRRESRGPAVRRWTLVAAAAMVVVAIISTMHTPPPQLPPSRGVAIAEKISPTGVVTGFLADPIPDIGQTAPARAIAEAGNSVREFGMLVLSPASAALRALETGETQTGEPQVGLPPTPRAVD